MSDLRTQERVDSGNLERNFDKRVGSAKESASPESVDTDLNVRPPSTRRNFAPDPLLINDQQPEESWLIASPTTSRSSAMDISPPRAVDRKTKVSGVASRPSSGRPSDAGSDISSTSRRASKIPRVAGLASNKSTPRQTDSLQSQSSGGSTTRKTEGKPRMAFGRKVEPTPSTKGKKNASGVSTEKFVGGAKKSSAVTSNPSSSLSRSNLPQKASGTQSPQSTNRDKLQKPDPKLNAQSKQSGLGQGLANSKSGSYGKIRSQPSTSAEEPSTLSKSELNTKAAIEESTTDPEHTATESASDVKDTRRENETIDPAQEGEITTPKTLAPGKEVKVWELPPLTDNPVTPEPLKGGQNIDPNLGMDASQKPDEPSLTPQKSQERESELASHPLRDSDSFTSDSMSRAGSPQLEVQSRPQSAATEKSLPVSTPPQTPSQSQVAVEIHSSEPPAWPAPGGEAVSAPTEGDRGVTREAHQDARSSLDRQEAASGGGSAPQNDTVKTVFETEASTMASGPAALENKKTPDGLSVRKPSGEVPRSPFNQQNSTIKAVENEQESKRAGIGKHKSTEQPKTGGNQEKEKKPTCCGCSVM